MCVVIDRAVTPKSRKAEPRERERKAAEPRRAPVERAAAAPKARAMTNECRVDEGYGRFSPCR